jgi:nucleoside-diphosphate-sugar epimerase
LAQKRLGYEPLVSFEEGLRRTVEWYRSEARAAGTKELTLS